MPRRWAGHLKTEAANSGTDCLTAKIAVEICEAITQGNSKLDLVAKEYADVTAPARRADAIEAVSERLSAQGLGYGTPLKNSLLTGASLPTFLLVIR